MKDWNLHTRETIKRLGLSPSKRLGQNFLTRYKIVNDMVLSADVNSNEHILEIGGGLGILSDAIYSKTKNLTIIEKDVILAKYLKESYPLANVINEDVVKIKLPSVDKIISNLPYSRSSELMKIILHSNVKSATVMLQKEFAERCASIPGSKEYSALSILSQLHSNPKKLFYVPPEAFTPKPRVTSMVIRFEIEQRETKNSHSEIELLAKNLFSLKRRILRSVLRGFLKRKIEGSPWEKSPYVEKRITHLSIEMLDEILTFLKSIDGWPLA